MTGPTQQRRDAVKRPGALYLFGRLVMAPIARLVYRPRVIGRKNVPQRGAVILASNHLSFIDSIVIPLMAPRRVQFLAKSQLLRGQRVQGRAVALVLHRDRRRRRASAAPARPRRMRWTSPSASSTPVRRSPSTRRAPARSTAASTRAAPASAGSR